MIRQFLAWVPVFAVGAMVTITLLTCWFVGRAMRRAKEKTESKPGLKCYKCGVTLRGPGVHCQNCGSRQKRPFCKPGKHRWILLTKIQMAPGAARWCTACNAAQLIVDAGDQTVGWRFLPVANVVASAKLLDLGLARGLGLIK